MKENPTVAEIAEAIECYAPRDLQESYDNSGLQIGNPEMPVYAVLMCLDVTEDTLREAINRQCNMIVSHHPVLFHGLKQITGSTPVQRIAETAIRHGIALYAAHTNLDSTIGGVSAEMGRLIGMTRYQVLDPKGDGTVGLGVIGDISPMPKMQFLRMLKETFKVKALRYSSDSASVVIRRVAICGGAGASLIPDAIEAGADVIVTGDVKYHDFTTYGQDILIADIGHYEGELCARSILTRILQDRYPDLTTYLSKTETNPIAVL